MILACCPNPALDVTYAVAQLTPGESHRVAEVVVRAGGKGTNVARVLDRLGSPVCLLTPLGGAAGEEFDADLRGAGLKREVVAVTGPTRRTVTVSSGSEATVFNEPGPALTAQEWSVFAERFATLVADAEVAVVSGSSPPGAPADGYAGLARLAAEHGVPVIVDAEGPLLAAVLAGRPTLVKINAAEARGVVGLDDPFAAGAELVRRGARGAIVTLGADGLAATVDGRRLRVRLAESVAGNPTGAGDALTAALAHGLAAGVGWDTLLADSVAVGAGAVAVAHAGDYDPELAGRLRPGVIVEEC